MDLVTLKRILTTFADKPADVDLSRGTIIVVIHDEIIEAEIIEKQGELFVVEAGQQMSAYHWIRDRIARVSLLADRILDYVPEEKYFVRASGNLLRQIESNPIKEDSQVDDAVKAVTDLLNRRKVGISTVLYLTSDAGEGKTTLINNLARSQAQKYRQKKTDWLIVPISLGSRPFMRLDDITVAELTNKLRFMLYYDAFIELVKLNVLVPALDGFEEVFVESSTGEAVSALGNLISDLSGSGRVLIAARKAYYEINSFATQAKFYDTLTDQSAVDFARVALIRWSWKHFEKYARQRGLNNPRELFDRVSSRLDVDHPLLTRAVLVKRLLDVALEQDIDTVLENMGRKPGDYFNQFVNTIIEREATTKWLFRGREEVAGPLLSVNQHYTILSMIAREMWINSNNALSSEYLDLLTDIFSSDQKLQPEQARQVKQRIHQHSLLVSTGMRTKQIGFDHEDFRRYFIGQALGADLIEDSEPGLLSFLRVASLPPQVVDASVKYLQRIRSELFSVRDRLIKIGKTAAETSYTKENCSLLLAFILEIESLTPTTIEDLSFPYDALREKRISSVTFKNCYFQPTAILEIGLTKCIFVECHFERLEIETKNHIVECQFYDCELDCLHIVEDEKLFFDPVTINKQLGEIGIKVTTSIVPPELELKPTEPDRTTELAEHAMRAFMRSTHINENVFRQRFGKARSNEFFGEVLPRLLSESIVVQVTYMGAGRQKRYKLNIPMRNIEEAIRQSKGSFDDFIKGLKEGHE